MEHKLARAVIVDKNFSKFIRSDQLPNARSQTSPSDIGLTRDDFLELFDSQLASRHLDLQARILKEKGCGFYTIGSSGHEGNAAIARVFRHTDMAFLHYRSGAFMVERARHDPSINMIREILLSLLAAKDDPISSGRHKVFGSVPLYVPPQTSTIASHLPKAAGTALSLFKAQRLGISSPLPADSVILCSFGDASVNHSTAQGAFNFAEWLAYTHVPVPLVYICEDNDIGISVPTPPGWIEKGFNHRPVLQYLFADGLNLADVYRVAQQAEVIARRKKIPVFLHIKVVRLMGHAGSDIESLYHNDKTIEKIEMQDPLLHSARIILENDFLTKEEIIDRYEAMREYVSNLTKELSDHPRLSSADEVIKDIIPQHGLTKPYAAKPNLPKEPERKVIFGEKYKTLKMKRNLSQMLNLALTDLLLQYPHCVLFGEDIAKKGGVYHVTAGLWETFGTHQVFNSILDEQSILGAAIGFAHNGMLPIAEIQFLAYLHNAIDQIRGEAATLSFFSSSQYTNPMVIRLPGLAYQKGFGGHFHNDNSLGILRDIPGIIIAVPSHGEDAVKMLRYCIKLANEQGRIIIFVEPIALYMTRDLHEKGDQLWLGSYPPLDQEIKLGEINVWGHSNETVIISYGNGYYLARQAAHILETQHHINVDVIDIRWITPLPKENLLKAVSKHKNILIVDECRKTGSVSEEIIALLTEHLSKQARIKRITGHDTFIPLGDAWEYVLPNKEMIVDAVLSFEETVMIESK